MKKLFSVKLITLIFIILMSVSAHGKVQYPAYEDVKKPFTVINNNKPLFKDDEFVTTAVEKYSNLDQLGRCGTAYAVLGKETMPTEERGSIGMIKPTGWKQAKYEGIVDSSPPYLYNRCHLIGFQLTGENANEKNLITGTRYLNIDGMLPFENKVAEYINSKGNHVLYRVSPVFEGNNLLASGVLMEAASVEDKGAGFSFCVYCFNAQPGINIDYGNGSSSVKGDAATNTQEENAEAVSFKPSDTYNTEKSAHSGEYTYVANKNTKKFHYADCSSVGDMKEKNKAFYNDRQEIINAGYVPCKRCNP